MDDSARPLEDLGDDVPFLSRFNVQQLRAIEQALAEHLQVHIEHVHEAGFTVMPESGSLLRVSWQGSAPITIEALHSIVDDATAEPASTGPQPRPGRPAPAPRLTRRTPRKRWGNARREESY